MFSVKENSFNIGYARACIMLFFMGLTLVKKIAEKEKKTGLKCLFLNWLA